MHPIHTFMIVTLVISFLTTFLFVYLFLSNRTLVDQSIDDFIKECCDPSKLFVSLDICRDFSNGKGNCIDLYNTYLDYRIVERLYLLGMILSGCTLFTFILVFPCVLIFPFLFL